MRLSRGTDSRHVGLWAGAINGRRLLLLRLEADAALEYLIFPDHHEAHASWVSPDCRPLDVESVFRQVVRGLIRRDCGELVLHAGAVAVDGNAIAILGASGRGKSTTLAALATMGCPLVCDDMAALQVDDGGNTMIATSNLGLKLWSDSLRLLGLAVGPLPKVHALTEKRVVDLPHTDQTAVPLAAILLAGPSASETAGKITRMDPARAVMALAAQHYPPFLPLSGNEHRFWLASLGRLVASVPAYEINRPPSFEDLRPFCGRLMALAGQAA